LNFLSIELFFHLGYILLVVNFISAPYSVPYGHLAAEVAREIPATMMKIVIYRGAFHWEHVPWHPWKVIPRMTMRRRDDSVYDPDEESVNVHSLAKNDAGHAHWEHVTESEFYRMGIGR